MSTQKNDHNGPKVTRRQVLGGGALVLGGVLLGDIGYHMADGSIPSFQPPANWDYPLNDPENIIYSVCLQCNTQCTLKTKFQNGTLVKIDGSAYSPMNLVTQVGFTTSLQDAAHIDGSICSKGQGGVQTLYDPYRLRKVLKRAGPRGSSQWQSIPFDQAIKEITTGGKLFAGIGENQDVSGFKDVFVLQDPALSKQMAADVANIRSGTLSVADFKTKYQDHLNVLIDPDHPDLGPKNNQFVLQGGRIAPDREAITQRFTFNALGSVNWYGHTTICEQAHHVAFQYATAQWSGASGWVKGTNHMKPDYTKSEFVIFWGTTYNEANFGPPPMSARISDAIVNGNLKIAVIDPRLSKTAAKGWWIPVRPSGDLALALGMINWIIANGRYDAAFLRNANKAAAIANGEKSWSNASWLVNTTTGKFLRASDAGIGDNAHFVVMVNGTPQSIDPNDAVNAIVGDLDVDANVNGIAVQSSFTVLKTSVAQQPMDVYVQESGIDQQTIVDLATEFTAHGKKAAIDFYRGPIKVTHGYYAAQAIILLNYLIGNVDHVGGFTAGGGGWDGMGSLPGKPFNLGKMHPGALTSFGVKTTRESSGSYESSTLFARDGYPAKRPWFPFTGDVYQEVVPAAYAEYPYPIKILWLHYGTPVLASPAGHLQIKMLQDTAKIPLLIATDVTIAETSMYADYIFPDLTYLERWSNPIGTSPVIMTKISKFRQPSATPLTESVTVAGEEMPISMDTVLLAIAQELGMSGFGANGLGQGVPLKRPEDYYLKMVANLAVGDAPDDAVSSASDAEVAIFRKARTHLPPSVFDETKWQAAVGSYWPQVITVLNRGGRYESYDKAYKGNFVAHTWGKMLDIYVEPVGSAKQSITGKHFSGVPKFEKLLNFDGTEVSFAPEYNLSLFTYKEIWGGQSRTSGNYSAQVALMPENFIYINAQDAQAMGLHDGNLVRVESPTLSGTFAVGPGQTSKVEGRVKVIQGVRPGSVAISWHYGHWAYGSRDIIINNQRIPGEAIRGKGLVPNPAMMVDGYLKDLTLTDPIAGDASYSASKIRLVKIGDGSTTGMPQSGYMSEGPVAALAQVGSQNINEWLADLALRSARGEISASDAQAQIAQRLGTPTKP